MIRNELINEEEISNRLDSLNGWMYIDRKICKEFVLNSFADAVAYIVKVSIEAEKADHHPELLLHSWNKVKISCSTTMAGGVTELDINLANQIERLNK